MRIGEVCGLRWCDVDFETGLISIRHSVAYAKGMGSFIKDTKTHDARGIPIDPVGLLPFLKETHEIDCGKLRLRGLTGAVEIGDCYILSEPGATFATTSYIRRAFKTFSETNGLMGTNDELITFHGLRHTNAAVMKTLGVDDRIAMERGGWSCESTYRKTYSYIFDQKKVDANTAINNFFAQEITHGITHEDQ